MLLPGTQARPRKTVALTRRQAVQQFCDADRNLQTAPIDSACLSLHFAETLHIADRSLGLQLRHGANRAMEPPPLALDLALQDLQFIQRIWDSVMRFHSCLAEMFPFRPSLDTLDPCRSQSSAIARPACP
jgi:hypothetical protein